jgi:hypothetical protein
LPTQTVFGFLVIISLQAFRQEWEPNSDQLAEERAGMEKEIMLAGIADRTKKTANSSGTNHPHFCCILMRSVNTDMFQ